MLVVDFVAWKKERLMVTLVMARDGVGWLLTALLAFLPGVNGRYDFNV